MIKYFNNKTDKEYMKSNLIKEIFKKPQSEMEKEILQQSEILKMLYGHYVRPDGVVMMNVPYYVNRVILIASGSSYNCAAIISYLLRDYAHISTQSIYASEFSQITDYEVESEALYVFISQSGETSDTIEALEKIREKTDKTLCVTNNEHSKLFEKANYKLLTYAGTEKSIAATKSMSAQIYVLCLFIAKIMQSKEQNADSLLKDLKESGDIIESVLKDVDYIKQIGQKLAGYNNISILGSGCFYPLAKEGALKIREVSYINTNAYPTGEFLHGHVAALNKKTAVLTILSQFNKNFGVNVMKKIEKDYTPLMITISNFSIQTSQLKSDYSIKFEYDNDIFLLFSTLVVFQLIALETGKKLKRDIDKPEGLNKVVKENP